MIVVIKPLLWGFIEAKVDNDDFNMSFPPCLALPRKGAMREVNLHTVARKEIAPENADLLALRNGIGGDESNTDGKGRAGILPPFSASCRKILQPIARERPSFLMLSR